MFQIVKSRETVIQQIKQKFGNWVHTYQIDYNMELVRLFSKDRKVVKVVNVKDYPDFF